MPERLQVSSFPVTDMDKVILGIDIGGTWFRIGAVDCQGQIRSFEKLPVKQVFTGKDPLGELESFLRPYLASWNVSAVCIGVPATVNAKRTVVLQAPNLAYLENLPLVEVLEHKLGVAVLLERDVNFTMAYDCRDLPKEAILCGFYFGTGIGNAIMIDGKILVGKNGTAGELGHIPVDGYEETCGCGNIGCIEPIAGGKYLARIQKEAFPDTPVAELFTRHGGDERLCRFIDRMAIAVATEVNLLDPDRILLGGGVIAMADFPREALVDRILLHARKPFPADNIKVLFPQDFEEKTVLGAAIYGWNAMK